MKELLLQGVEIIRFSFLMKRLMMQLQSKQLYGYSGNRGSEENELMEIAGSKTL